MAPSFRCDARVFPPLRRHAESMRRFVVLRRRSSTTSSRHLDSAKNCMACFKGCWIEMCCKKSSRVLAGPVPLVAWRSPVIVVPVVVNDRRDRADEAHPVHLASNGGFIVCRICASCHVARPLSKVGCINTAALPSQNGNEHIASISRREPRSEDMRQPCRQVVCDHPVVPSKQVAQQCLERGHPVAQGLCVLLVHSWLHHASLLQGWPPMRLQLDCRIVPHENKKVFILVVPFRPSCRWWTRTTSEEPFFGK